MIVLKIYINGNYGGNNFFFKKKKKLNEKLTEDTYLTV